MDPGFKIHGRKSERNTPSLIMDEREAEVRKRLRATGEQPQKKGLFRASLAENRMGLDLRW
jgi:hypothetical protein